jgi:CubicO group peptidase (beta-lactamase class C family)
MRYDLARRLCSMLFAITFAVLGLAPGSAQSPDNSADPATALACDQSVLKEVSVKGINAAFVGKKKYSTKLVPSMGFATSDMSAAIDPTVANFMNLYGIPGGAVALTYKGKLVFAKSYGYVDVADSVFTTPDSRMRIASVSKPITTMGIMKLVHDGDLKLNDHPFPFAEVGTIIAGTPGNYYYGGGSDKQNPLYNRELSNITVNDLLHHAGGWDRDTGPDLTGYTVLQGIMNFLSDQKGSPSGPPDCTTLMAFVETQPLQFAPGTMNDYSNVGFCAASETIRETTGMPFIDYMTAKVLGPLGMHDTTLGSTQKSKALDRESVYYDTTDGSQPSLFPPYPVVTAPYSGIGALEALQGAGGFVSTAIDLALFGGAIANGKPSILPGPGSSGSAACKGSKPPADCGWPQQYYTDSLTLPEYECVDPSAVQPDGSYPVGDSCTSRGVSKADEYEHTAYGAGWDVAQPNVVSAPVHVWDNINFVKDGGFQGLVSSLVTTGDGYSFAALFNQNDNTIPGPEASFFWPSCAGKGTPAAADGNCVLQAAYNHGTWDVDFNPQFAETYSGWMSASAFKAYLAFQASHDRYPSRLEGRLSGTLPQYRARFGKTSTAPKYMYGEGCPATLSAIKSASASTPLVSLQRFIGSGGSYEYQAVWSAPIP